MDTNTKYSQQRDTLAASLGVSIADPVQGGIGIFLGAWTGETLALGTALQQVQREVRISAYAIRTDVLQSLEGKKIVNGAITDFDFTMDESLRGTAPGSFISATGNTRLFKALSGNKWVCNRVLKNAFVPLPREMLFSFKYGQDIQDIQDFIKSLGKGKRAVVKPIDGKGGSDVHIIDSSNIGKLETYISKDQASIIQEKIDSYPIYFGGKKMDWNLRVLATEKEQGEISISGITGRLDKDGGPINRSKGAENKSLEQLLTLAGIPKKQHTQIRKNIEDLTCHALQSLLGKIRKRESSITRIDNQVLSGVDIILDKDLVPHIIEVNDAESGCMYELAMLEGVEALHPIATSIIKKAEDMAHFRELIFLLAEKFGEHIITITNLILEGKIIVSEDATSFSFAYDENEIPSKIIRLLEES